jgi:acyl-CoA synthetase (AMP-forming)/AMP-acid ligase II
MTTIGEVIRQHAEERPEYPAIVASGVRIFSYRELRDQIDKIGNSLRDAGFDRNARIVVALENSPQAALAIVAIASCAVAVPLDPKLATPEVETTFALVCPSAVLLPKGNNSAARRVAERQGLTVIEVIAANDDKLCLEFVVPPVGAAVGFDCLDPKK